jgi:hypothetical protein
MKQFSTAVTLLLTLLITLAACQTNRMAQRTATEVPADFSLSIQRTGCRGRCPIYQLSIDHTGKVVYTGERFTDLTGTYEKTLEPAQLLGVVKYLDEKQFWAMDSVYDQPGVMDVPAVTVASTSGGRTHQVRARFNVPEEVVTFYEQLEVLIGPAGYTKREE